VITWRSNQWCDWPDVALVA